MKKLLIPILFLLFVFPAMSQGFVSISGTITDSVTGNPIANHAVTISNDSTGGWFYYHTEYTGTNGFYVDTVPVPLGSQGILYVRTSDCMNNMHQAVLNYNPTSMTFTVNFQICYANAPCTAGFSSQQLPSLGVQFTDASLGGGNIRQWNFGDGGTSTQMDPIHYYSQPGNYDVTLTIGALGTPCYTSISQAIQVWDSTGGGGCHAAFVVYPDSNAMYSFQFWNQSTGNNIHTYTWNFGDGTIQTVTIPGSPNVSHTYVLPGIYLVCLAIQSNDSSCYDISCDTLVVGTPPPCQAAFTYYTDSLNAGNTFHFIDQSSGSITSWSWNFGDQASGANNTSTLQNPTHAFSAAGTYNVCLTIFGANNCSDVICHTVIVSATPGCQANFSYSVNPGPGNNIVSFTDLSTGNPTSWLWSFGDGTSGNVQNPVHTYTAPGTYSVNLTITGNNCTSTFIQNIVILDSLNYHQIYGQVFAGNFPVTMGTATIFSLDTTANYQPYVATSPIDSNGVYYFTMVPNGNYYILAMPFDSNGYLPTYYGNSINWEQATLITLGNPNNPYNINLVQSDQMTSGPGSASGQINMGDVMSSMIDNVNMLLMNSQGKAIGFRQVAADGAFDFSTLAYGSYYLHAEMPGITSDYVLINLSPEKPHADVNMTFTGSNILGVSDELTSVSDWSVYPNPVTDHVVVNINMKQGSKAEISIYNLAGQMVANTKVTLDNGTNQIKMPTRSLKIGMYTLNIRFEEGVALTTKLIKME